MGSMGWDGFFVVLVCCGATMLACRVIPLFALKGKNLPEGVERALGFIPPAAFAALVANDLFFPGMFDAGPWPAAAPRGAAGGVALGAGGARWGVVCAVSGGAADARLSLV